MNHRLRKPAASFRRAASPILSTRRFKSARAGVRSPFVSQSSPRLCLFDAPRSCRSSELPPPGRCPSNGPSALLCGGRLTLHFHWSESVSTVILKGHLPPRSGLQLGSLSLSARGRRLPWPARCRRSRPGCSGRRITAPFRAIRLLSATAHDFSSFSSFRLRRGACFMPSILSGVCPACPAVRSRSAGLSYAAGFPPRVLGLSTQQAPFN